MLVIIHAACAVDVDSPCSEFDGGTPLHIAAQNLALETARVLLAKGAYPFAVDRNGKLPLGKSYSELHNIFIGVFKFLLLYAKH